MADSDEKILKALEALQADVTAIKTEHGKQLTEQGKDIKEVKGDIKTLELKVAIIHDQNKKDHQQILDMLYDSNEINYKVLKEELKKLEDRIAHLEKQHNSSKN